MQGAYGAYVAQPGRIYLNADWLNSASDDQVLAVLTEELGHHLDALLNRRDTPGDEGELLAALLLGPPPSWAELRRLRSENDRMSLLIDGNAVAAEASAPDTLAPTIEGLSLGASTLDPSRPGGAYLSAALQFSDNLSGFSSGSLGFRSTTSTQTRTVSLSTNGLQGSNLAGSLYASQAIDIFTADGTWILSEIRLNDKAGNSLSKSFGNPDWDTFLASSGIIKASFDVVNGATQRPLESLTIDPSKPGDAFLWGRLPAITHHSFNLSFTSDSGQTAKLFFSDRFPYGIVLGDTRWYPTGPVISSIQLNSKPDTWRLTNVYIARNIPYLISSSDISKDCTSPDWNTILTEYGIIQSNFKITYGTNSSPTDWDNLPPKLQSISLSQSALDPSQQGGAYLFASVQFTDNISGFDSGLLNFKNSSTPESISLPLSSSSLQGSILAGTIYTSKKLDASTATGNWYLASFEWRDKASNSITKRSFDQDSYLVPDWSYFTIVNEANPAPIAGSDSFTPTIQSFSLDALTLDPSQPGGAFLSGKLSFKDNLSGFSYGYFEFTAESGATTYLQFDNKNIISGSDLSGIAFASKQLHANSAAGMWKLTQVSLRDYADNAIHKYSYDSDWNSFLSANGITKSSFQVVYGSDPTTPATPQITLAVSPSTVAEDGTATILYTFTRSGPITSALTVNYTVAGTATLGTDYTGIEANPAKKSVTFSAGSATALVTVDPTPDTQFEADETIILTLAAGIGYTVSTTSAATGIINGETYTAGPVSVNSVNLGSTRLGYAIKNGAATPVQVSFSGQFASPTNPGAGWTPIAAAAAASGYELYWKNSITSQFVRWNLNSTRALTTGTLLSTAELLTAESNIGFDLNADGVTGLVYTPGSTTINGVNLGSNPLGYAIKNGTATPLQVSFAGQFASPTNPGAGWAPIAATAEASGYDLYWKNSITSQFVRWNLNSTGALSTGTLLSSANLYAAESSLNADLDKDGITGLPFIAGTATIKGVNLGTTPLGYGIKVATSPAIPVTVSGQNASASNPGSGWNALAAAPSANGFQLYWKNVNTNQFARWNLGSSGTMTSASLLTQADIFSAETSLNFDLNNDKRIGIL